VREQAVRDVHAAHDDVLLAAGDVDVAFVVLPGEVAVSEAVLGDRHELVRPLPVGRRELAVADDHLALERRDDWRTACFRHRLIEAEDRLAMQA
jgi:hypothetical protein